MGAIDDASRFYEIKKGALSNQGIQGTKDLAQDIRSWRDANYNNLLGRVQNFLIWDDNQTLFDTASDRLTQSQLIINSLKIIDDENAKKLFIEAKDGLANANDLNNRAGEAISRGLAQDETIGIIKQSLSSLALTYKSFLGIGDRIRGTNSSSTSE